MEYKDGTSISGFVTEKENHSPRECGNCKWFNNGSCHNPEVMSDPEVPDNPDGTKKVDADDCCNNFQNVQLPDTYATCLNRLLANSIVLRDLYRKCHWQVTGGDFYSLHKLFDKHYEQQDELVDMIAERIQSLGIITVATASDTIKYATVNQAPMTPETPQAMLCRLHRAHQLIIDQCKILADKSLSFEDQGTNDLVVTDVLRKNEKQNWFIREQLGYDPIEQGKFPLLIMVRHGETTLNAQDCFRSWMDVPLDEKGIEQAERVSKFLGQFKIAKIYCSDLSRAVSTAMMIQDSVGGQVMKEADLRPWHLGELAGKSRQENIATLDYYIDHPEEVIPGGESLNNFQNRMNKVFDVLVQDADVNYPTIIVAHTSLITALNKWIDGGYAGRAEEEESVGPGGACALYSDPDKDSYMIDVIFGKPKSADYGS